MDSLGCIHAWLIWEEQEEQLEVPQIQISAIPSLAILILLLPPLTDLHPAIAAQLLTRGSRGQDVVALQNDLKQAGCFPEGVRSTGYYGKVTQTAVKKLQRTHGLRVDGIVGTQTRSALNYGKTCQSLASSGVLKFGYQGENVRQLQLQLNSWLKFSEKRRSGRFNIFSSFPNGYQLQVNHILDKPTKIAVLDFQKYFGLQQDGVVGPKTSQILSTPPISALIGLLKHRNPNLRIKGSQALATFGHDQFGCPEESGAKPGGMGDIEAQEVKAAIPHLVQLLKDQDKNVRIAAACTLDNMNSQMVLALLDPFLNGNKNPEVKNAVFENYYKYKSRKPIKGKDSDVLIRAVNQVGKSSVKKVKAYDKPSIEYLKNKNESWEVRLNVFANLVKANSKEYLVTIEPLIKSFVIEALQDDPNERKDKGEDTSEGGRTSRDEYRGFYLAEMPPYKRHAFFLATIDPKRFPSLEKVLVEILNNDYGYKDYDYKARYSAAFILGYHEVSETTIGQLKKVVDDPKEDFDLRWMSASSLVRLGENMNYFFKVKNLNNPNKSLCERQDDVYDPFIGWCEVTRGGGGGGNQWLEAITQEGEKNKEQNKQQQNRK